MSKCFLRNFQYVDDSIRVTLGIINATSSFFALFGNLLVITVILCRKTLRTRSNYLICSLAATDLLVGLISQPMVAARLLLQPLWNNCMVANISTYIGGVLCGASACTLCVISYNRYLHIVKWKTYHLCMSRRKLSILIAICWIWPCNGSLFILFPSTKKIHYILLIIMTFVVVTCIVACYRGIYSFIREKRRVFASNRAPQNSSNGELAQWKRNSNLAISSAIVIGCFAVCWLPFAVCMIYVTVLDVTGKLHATHNGTLIAFRYITSTIGICNSSINPLIYCWRNKALRVATKEFLLKKILKR